MIEKLKFMGCSVLAEDLSSKIGKSVLEWEKMSDISEFTKLFVRQWTIILRKKTL